MGLVVKVLCGHFCIACLRPLTRRYSSGQIYSFKTYSYANHV
ncbi:hypothetical protein MA617_004549 [Vibrio vulnificus]|nr:hypothetical protein [Vibrio vulnificus]